MKVYSHLLLAADAPELEGDGGLDELVDLVGLVLVEADGALVEELDDVAHGAVRDPLHLDVPRRPGRHGGEVEGGGGDEPASVAAEAVVVVLADGHLVARQCGRGGQGVVSARRKGDLCPADL